MGVAILGQKRAKALRELENLHRLRGEAVLDKQPTDAIDTRIRSAEETVRAMEDAEQAFQRRENERRRASSLESRRYFLERLEQTEERRLVAIAKAESAARELSAALVAMNTAVEEGRVLNENLRHYVRDSQVGMASTIDAQHIHWRLSERLAAVMKPALGGGWVFGQVRFPMTNLPPEEEWAKAERHEGARELDARVKAAKQAEAA